MSKKRKREVDLDLVQIYQDLADEREDFRVAASVSLIDKVFLAQVTPIDQVRSIVTRLFRGLCSGRKAARQGFAMALCEMLAMLPLENSPLSASDVVDILEAETVLEGGASGQDERDHYFGRLFGAETILMSGILLRQRHAQGPEPADWTPLSRLVDVICGVALKKPWLRQECGWVLFSHILPRQGQLLPLACVVLVVEKLAAHELIRTPEGLAIWVMAEKHYPAAQLPTKVWKHGDPFRPKNLDLLANILKDARPPPGQDDDHIGAQGSAMWSPNLHFAWDIVLTELFEREASDVDGEPAQIRSSHSAPAKDTRIQFGDFWKVAVDKSLFATSGSTERRAWGFDVWRKVLEQAPSPLLHHTFTPQAVHYLVDSLKSSMRLLQKRAKKVVEAICHRLGKKDGPPSNANFAKACIRSLVESVAYGDFDQITQTKTMHSLVESADQKALQAFASTLGHLRITAGKDENRKSAVSRQRSIIALELKVLSAALRTLDPVTTAVTPGREAATLILRGWIRGLCLGRPSNASQQPLLGHDDVCLDENRDFLKERVSLGFEQALKSGLVGCRLLQDTVLVIRSLELDDSSTMATTFDDDIPLWLQKGWESVEQLPTSFGGRHTRGASDGHHSADAGTASLLGEFPTIWDGLCLLYCLVLFQIYTGEVDAVEVLHDIAVYHDELELKRNGHQNPQATSATSDAFVEIILTFAARPSKFLRRITNHIFDAFAPQLTLAGLESLCRILSTKENLHGQQEVFQAVDVEMQDEGDDDGDSEAQSGPEGASDSDVERSSVREPDSPTSSGWSSGSDDEDPGAGEVDDPELAAFNAALASALGTEPFGATELGAVSETSSSDEDMNDEEMLELDAKLAEVFRARNAETRGKKSRDAREAKESVVHFKNRVLDLIESYLKILPRSPLALDLILPLLSLVRTTQTKQLAGHASQILQQFASRAKGANLPGLDGDGRQTQHAIEILQSIHDEVCMEASNAHKNSASQMSLLVVKSLVHADPAHVRQAIAIYASTRIRQMAEKSCRVTPSFFTDWNNWCQSAREHLVS